MSSLCSFFQAKEAIPEQGAKFNCVEFQSKVMFVLCSQVK
uniref:Uncharacterized protein n=1 Tax=Anguilla anguilla TaxID=7936 RepID=A0A0E9W3S0_ANGAN